MSNSQIQYKPSNRAAKYKTVSDLSKIMMLYAESYIKQYNPSMAQIKLLRSMRICKTPALGGRMIKCNNCGSEHYIYLSCGHSHCPLCQSIKREQWVDKLNKELYNVPYVHMVFTLPHQLNGLARNNQSKIYSLLMRSSWATVKRLSADTKNIGGLPGMINVLHTFGSDIKYHIHCHCLVTFGALSQNGDWLYPKRKHKLARYRKINGYYKQIFMQGLEKLYKKEVINYHMSYEEVKELVAKKSWVVHNTLPTMDTKVIEIYLARYINRIAISKSRVSYLKQTKQVSLLYNNYKEQQTGKPAPKAIKVMDPLIFIDQFMQHVLPPYFQKTRRYGLHASPTKKKHAAIIDRSIKRNGHGIRTVLQIITQLIKDTPYECAQCQSTDYSIAVVLPDKNWLQLPIKNKSPPSIKDIKTILN